MIGNGLESASPVARARVLLTKQSHFPVLSARLFRAHSESAEGENNVVKIAFLAFSEQKISSCCVHKI